MTIPYKDILLWGHSFEDFVAMFGLKDADLKGNILDVCGGPNSFNAEGTEKGIDIISCDPLFDKSAEEIRQEVDRVFNEMLAIVHANRERFLWDQVSTPEGLAEKRKKNIDIFLKDFPQGKKQGRYQYGKLPDLAFKPYQFDLALCSHYLFANCPDQSIEFHVNSITNLCQIAKEVRIFPLLDSHGEIPAIVGPVMQELCHREHGLEFKAVPYQFQKKGNAMLRVWALACPV